MFLSFQNYNLTSRAIQAVLTTCRSCCQLSARDIEPRPQENASAGGRDMQDASNRPARLASDDVIMGTSTEEPLPGLNDGRDCHH